MNSKNLDNLKDLLNIIGRMSRAKHVARTGEMRNAHSILV